MYLVMNCMALVNVVVGTNHCGFTHEAFLLLHYLLMHFYCDPDARSGSGNLSSS